MLPSPILSRPQRIYDTIAAYRALLMSDLLTEFAQAPRTDEEQALLTNLTAMSFLGKGTSCYPWTFKQFLAQSVEHCDTSMDMLTRRYGIAIPPSASKKTDWTLRAAHAAMSNPDSEVYLPSSFVGYYDKPDSSTLVGLAYSQQTLIAALEGMRYLGRDYDTDLAHGAAMQNLTQAVAGLLTGSYHSLFVNTANRLMVAEKTPEMVLFVGVAPGGNGVRSLGLLASDGATNLTAATILEGFDPILRLDGTAWTPVTYADVEEQARSMAAASTATT